MGGRFYRQDRLGRFNYLAGASYEQSNYTTYGTSPSWLDMTEDPAYKKAKLYARTTYLLGPDDHRISLFLHHTSHTGGVGRPNRDFEHRYDTANLSYLWPISDAWNLQLKTGYRSYHRDWGRTTTPATLASGSATASKKPSSRAI